MEEERSLMASSTLHRESEDGDWSHTESGFAGENYHGGKNGGKEEARKAETVAAGLDNEGRSSASRRVVCIQN